MKTVVNWICAMLILFFISFVGCDVDFKLNPSTQTTYNNKERNQQNELKVEERLIGFESEQKTHVKESKRCDCVLLKREEKKRSSSS